MNTIKNISLFLILGLVVQYISDLIKSDYLSEFLEENLIMLLVGLLAINTTTISIIMTKVGDIIEKYQIDFTRTIKSLKNSIIEQVIILIFASVVLIIKDSDLIKFNWPHSEFTLNILLYTCFFYSIYILFDTANAVFIIHRYESKRIEDNNKK